MVDLTVSASKTTNIIYDAWTQLLFFKTGDIRLDGDTPLERLKNGDVAAVVLAAACYGKAIAA